MPSIKEIADSSIEDVKMLLTALGQTFSPDRGTPIMGNQSSLTVDDIASSSTEDVQRLLTSMGQTSMPARTEVTPLNRIQEIQGVLDARIPDSQEAVNQLLMNMGYTGRLGESKNSKAAEKAPMKDTVKSKDTSLDNRGEESGLAKPDLAANLASVQSTVDRMMLDPEFRKSIGFVEPADPLAADRNGFNLPKTNKANTLGAEQRINARAQAERTGVTATKDANGQLIISNMDAALSSFDPAGQNGKSPLTMSSLLTQLRGASNATEAAPIMDNIRATVAAEQAKINAEAMQFAANKLGIPKFEKELQQAELLDRNDPAWFLGIGDSKNTSQIRQQLGILRGQAKQQAELFLETNLSSGMLKAQALGASEELKRIDKAEGKKDNLVARTEDYFFRKKELAEEKAITLLAQASPLEISALKLLNPSLANSDSISVGRAIEDLNKPVNAGKVAAIKAYGDESGNSLIGLSVMGNADAKTLLFKKEQNNNPAFSEVDFNAKMAEITTLADSKEFAATAAKARFNGSTTSPEARKFIQEQTLAKTSGDAKDKAMARQQRIADAIQITRKGATDRFLGDVRNWKSLDPEFNSAMVAAQQQRGKTDLSTVLDIYIGSDTGMKAAQKILAFNEVARAAFDTQANSLFGRADFSYAQKMLANKTKTLSVGYAASSFGTGGMIEGDMGKQIYDFFKKPAIPIDQATGLPLAQ